MKYLSHDLGDLDHAYIIPFSDLHLGDPYFDEKKFIGYRDWVLAQDNAFVTINGDILNAALPDSVSDSMSENFNPKTAMKRAQEILGPLFYEHRVLCYNDGNHEFRIRKRTALDVGELICDHFGQENLYTGDGALLKLSLGRGKNGKRVVYTAYISHGNGGGKRPGGKVNGVQDYQRVVVADIYVEGHVHMPAAFTGSIFVPDLHNNNIMEVKQTFVCGGSFLRWGGYSERKGYYPARTGCPRIRISGQRKDVHCSI